MDKWIINDKTEKKTDRRLKNLNLFAEINENLNETIKNYQELKPGDSILWALPVFGTANRKTISLENKNTVSGK